METLTTQQLLVPLITCLTTIVGFYALLHRTFILPEKNRRQALYARLEGMSQDIALMKQWRDTHDGGHRAMSESVARMATGVEELRKEIAGVRERLVALEQELRHCGPLQANKR